MRKNTAETIVIVAFIAAALTLVLTGHGAWVVAFIAGFLIVVLA